MKRWLLRLLGHEHREGRHEFKMPDGGTLTIRDFGRGMQYVTYNATDSYSWNMLAKQQEIAA